MQKKILEQHKRISNCGGTILGLVELNYLLVRHLFPEVTYILHLRLIMINILSTNIDQYQYLV